MSLPHRVYKRMPRRAPKSIGFNMYALRFGGSQYIWVGTPSILKIPHPLFFAIFRTTTGTSTQAIYRWGNYGVHFGAPRLYGPEHKAGLFYYDSAGGGHYVDSLSDVDDGRWHAVATYFDGSEIGVIVDGVLENTIADTTPIYYGGYGAAVGRESIWDVNYFSGDIAVFMVYDLDKVTVPILALVRYNMLNYHNPVREGLVLWYAGRLSPDKSTVYDLSGNGLHGENNGVGTVPLEAWRIRAEVGL